MLLRSCLSRSERVVRSLAPLRRLPSSWLRLGPTACALLAAAAWSLLPPLEAAEPHGERVTRAPVAAPAAEGHGDVFLGFAPPPIPVGEAPEPEPLTPLRAPRWPRPAPASASPIGPAAPRSFAARPLGIRGVQASTPIARAPASAPALSSSSAALPAPRLRGGAAPEKQRASERPARLVVSAPAAKPGPGAQVTEPAPRVAGPAPRPVPTPTDQKPVVEVAREPSKRPAEPAPTFVDPGEMVEQTVARVIRDEFVPDHAPELPKPTEGLPTPGPPLLPVLTPSLVGVFGPPKAGGILPALPPVKLSLGESRASLRVTAVPEPGTGLLLAMGLAGLALARRR